MARNSGCLGQGGFGPRGFRAQGLEVQGLGLLGFWGLGLRGQRFRIQGFWGLGFRAFGFRVQGFRLRGFRAQGFRVYNVVGFRAIGFQSTWDFQLWGCIAGFEVQGFALGFRVQDLGSHGYRVKTCSVLGCAFFELRVTMFNVVGFGLRVFKLPENWGFRFIGFRGCRVQGYRVVMYLRFWGLGI